MNSIHVHVSRKAYMDMYYDLHACTCIMTSIPHMYYDLHALHVLLIAYTTCIMICMHVHVLRIAYIYMLHVVLSYEFGPSPNLLGMGTSNACKLYSVSKYE